MSQFGLHFNLTVMGVSWNFAYNLDPPLIPARPGAPILVGIQFGVLVFGQYLGWGTSKEWEPEYVSED